MNSPRLAILLAALAAPAAGPAHAAAVGFGSPVVVTPPQNANFNRALQSSAVADIDGDQRADLVVYAAGFGSPQLSDDVRFFVYLQAAPRQFSLASDFTAVLGAGNAYDPVGIDLCDLDGDHRAELLIANTVKRELVVLKRDAQGAFLPAASLPSPFPRVYQVECRDLDHDGTNDLVINSNQQGVAVFHGLGNLGFAAPAYSLTYPVDRVSFGDLDGDGRSDLLSATRWGLGSVGVGQAMDDRRFRAPVRVASASNTATAAAAGDLRSGPAAELVEVHAVDEYPTPNQLERYATLGLHSVQADGSFLLEESFRIRDVGAQDPAHALDLADLDRDGDLDAVVFNAATIDVIAQGPQGLSLETSVPLLPAGPAAQPDNSEVLDIDGDGCPDLAAMRDYAYVFAFQSCQAAQGSPSPRAMAIPRARGPGRGGGRP